MFAGGPVGDPDLASIRLGDGELRAYRMVAAAEAAGLLRDHVWRRVERAISCLGDGGAAYLHDGR